MSSGARSFGPAVVALALVGAAAAADGPAPPPVPALSPADARHAVFLERGQLRKAPSPSAAAEAAMDAGAILRWLGETTDDFGRSWQIVGDPQGWSLRRTWYVVPFDPGSIPRGETSAWISGLRAPPEELPDGEAEAPITLADDWWSRVDHVGPGHPYEAAGLVAVPAVEVSEAQVEELLRLVGGVEALGPWPEEPAWGQLHVPGALPLMFVHGQGGWRPMEPPRFIGTGPSLLGNPDLRQRSRDPVEPTGRPVACWTLVGGLDASGTVVGRVSAGAAAPKTPAPAPGTSFPGARFLGGRDLRGRLLPVAPEAMARPLLARPSSAGNGVRVEDTSRRQAAFLEQRLPGPVVSWLRGREVTLRVRARRLPESEDVATAGIELVVGGLRQTVSRSLGAQASELVIEATVPEDADEVVVRLLTQDRSVAVQETGDVIFDRAVLVPASWSRPSPSAIWLHRVRLSHYVPARRYTRAALAVSRRAPEELAAAWGVVGPGEWGVDRRRRILTGRLEPGMTRREVELAWGAPETRTPLVGAATRWDYEGRSATFTADGELVAWTVRERGTDDRSAYCLADLFEPPEAP